MKIRVFCVFTALLCLPVMARAEQDFYGIQMRNEHWAENMVLKSGPSADPQDLLLGPVIDHEIHAEASLTPAAGDRLNFRVNVINESPRAIASDYEYRDFFIYTRDGRKFSLIDENDDPKLNTIEPKSSRMFSPSLGNLRVRNEDVRMVGCSFDLGRVQIFLFPWSYKEEIGRLTSPAPPLPAPSKKSSRFSSKRERTAPAEPAYVPVVSEVASVPAAVVPAAAQAVAEMPVEEAADGSRQRLDQAIKNFVYKPADAVGSALRDGSGMPAYPAAPESDYRRPVAAQAAPAPEPPPAPEASAPSPAPTPVPAANPVPVRSDARIIGYDKQYNFVTMNMGFKDGLRQNMALNILRDGKTIAQAKVKQLRDRVAAAILMPGTVRSEVRPGDKISFV